MWKRQCTAYEEGVALNGLRLFSIVWFFCFLRFPLFLLSFLFCN